VVAMHGAIANPEGNRPRIGIAYTYCSCAYSVHRVSSGNRHAKRETS
jgi:hypothetical protein